MTEKSKGDRAELQRVADQVLIDAMPHALKEHLGELVDKGATDDQILYLIDQAIDSMRGRSKGFTRLAVQAYLASLHKSGTKPLPPPPPPAPIAAEPPALSPSKKPKS